MIDNGVFFSCFLDDIDHDDDDDDDGDDDDNARWSCIRGELRYVTHALHDSLSVVFTAKPAASVSCFRIMSAPPPLGGIFTATFFLVRCCLFVDLPIIIVLCLSSLPVIIVAERRPRARFRTAIPVPEKYIFGIRVLLYVHCFFFPGPLGLPRVL